MRPIALLFDNIIMGNHVTAQQGKYTFMNIGGFPIP